MKSVLSKTLSLFVCFGLTSAGLGQDRNIIETATTAGEFSTLLKAMEAAGLSETLKHKGPFTVLAPTDEAFKKLPKGKLESLLKPENKAQLADVLINHVINGRVDSKLARSIREATALNDNRIEVQVKQGNLFLNDARVTGTDVACVNGVIHTIDRVLLEKRAPGLPVFSNAPVVPRPPTKSIMAAATAKVSSPAPVAPRMPAVVPKKKITSPAPAAARVAAVVPKKEVSSPAPVAPRMTAVKPKAASSTPVGSSLASVAPKAASLSPVKIRKAAATPPKISPDPVSISAAVPAAKTPVVAASVVQDSPTVAPQSLNLKGFLKMVIKEGGHQYNHGNLYVTEGIYRTAASALMMMPGALGNSDRDLLAQAIEKSANSRSSKSRSWIYLTTFREILANQG